MVGVGNKTGGGESRSQRARDIEFYHKGSGEPLQDLKVEINKSKFTF